MVEVITTHAPALLVVLPLAAAVVTYLFPARRSVVPAAALTLLSVTAVSAVLAWTVWSDGPFSYSLGGWGSPLGIDLYADGLTGLMLLMAVLVLVPCGAYGAFYFSGKKGAAGRGFWPLFFFLAASVNALFLSADIFNLYVTLELMSISAVGLVVVYGGRESVASGMRYMIAAITGSLLYLLGVALAYSATGTLDLAGPVAGGTAFPPAAAALMTAGLAVKTALFPLHFWLPPAHGTAAPPVSALLSALVVKGSFYILLRLWLGPFPAVFTEAAGVVLGAAGAAAIVWGSAAALVQKRIKILVAYSTVAQIGYLFLVFPLAHGPDPYQGPAAGGGVLHALSHAGAKAAMFLAAGNLVHAAGRDSLDAMGSAALRSPVSMLAFGFAGITLMGMPPSGGFAAKWLLLTSALEDGQWWWAAVMLAGGLLAGGYVFMVLRHAFARPVVVVDGGRVPRPMEAAAVLLSLASIALGFAAAPAMELLGRMTP